MDFNLTEEQRLVQEQARRFAENEIRPTLLADEQEHRFRPEIVRRMGELGFFGCALPEAHGGNGMGFLESVLMAEQIAKVSPSWRLPFNMQNLGPAVTVNQFGAEAQKRRLYPWMGLRGKPGIFRHHRTQYRLRCGGHGDYRQRPGGPLGNKRAEDVDQQCLRGRCRAGLRGHGPREEI